MKGNESIISVKEWIDGQFNQPYYDELVLDSENPPPDPPIPPPEPPLTRLSKSNSNKSSTNRSKHYDQPSYVK